MVSKYYLKHQNEILQKLAQEREGRKKERLNKIMEIALSETDKAYIAGFVDGEGYIGCFVRKDSKNKLHRPTLAIVNTNIDVLLWIKSLIKTGFITKPRVRSANHRACYDYRITNMIDIASVCKTLLPYLKIKKQTAILVMDYIYERLSRVNAVEKDRRGRFVRVLGKQNNECEKEILNKLLLNKQH